MEYYYKLSKIITPLFRASGTGCLVAPNQFLVVFDPRNSSTPGIQSGPETEGFCFCVSKVLLNAQALGEIKWSLDSSRMIELALLPDGKNAETFTKLGVSKLGRLKWLRQVGVRIKANSIFHLIEDKERKTRHIFHYEFNYSLQLF